MTADDVMWMPAMNACLNGLATVCLVVGWRRIRRRDVPGHRNAMLTAAVLSGAFLVSYVIHKAIVRAHRPYMGDGIDYAVYQAILWSHLALAIAMAWLVPRTLWLALKGRHAEHRRIARRTFPIWLYVSVTGVVIYLMLYPFRPEPAG